jgi:hypothetical protein
MPSMDWRRYSKLCELLCHSVDKEGREVSDEHYCGSVLFTQFSGFPILDFQFSLYVIFLSFQSHKIWITWLFHV